MDANGHEYGATVSGDDPMNTTPESCRNVAGEWAAIASEGLCEAARASVRREIESKFADDAARRSEGALESAILDLGDPVAAARGLRRRYLSESEYAYLKCNGACMGCDRRGSLKS